MREILKQCRIKKKYTQAQMAELSGIARNTYTNIELGVKNPSFNVALKIKEALKTKDDKIFLQTNVS